jgi:error-prone DNA polymerase
MKLSEHVVQDYSSTSLSLKAHPVSFIRETLSQLHIVKVSDLAKGKDGDMVKVAGLVLVRQRPGTAKGICFMTIEDETGWANLVIFQNLFDQYRKEIMQSTLIMVEGKLQVEGEVIHVIVESCHNFSKLLRKLTPSESKAPQVATFAFPDRSPEPTKKTELNVKEKIFIEARNFK